MPKGADLTCARAIVEEQQLRRAEAAVAPVTDEKERCGKGARLMVHTSTDDVLS